MEVVELVYVDVHKQVIHYSVPFREGSTVADAVRDCDLYQKHPETKELSLGIYAKKVSLDTKLRAGDRIEVYRPLGLDPKDNRRRRALKS